MVARSSALSAGHNGSTIAPSPPPRPKPRARRHAGWRCNIRSGHFMVAQSSNLSSCRTLAKSPPRGACRRSRGGLRPCSARGAKRKHHTHPSPPHPKPRGRRPAGWRCNDSCAHFIPAQSSNLSSRRQGRIIAAPGGGSAIARRPTALIPRGGRLRHGKATFATYVLPKYSLKFENIPINFCGISLNEISSQTLVGVKVTENSS